MSSATFILVSLLVDGSQHLWWTITSFVDHNILGGWITTSCAGFSAFLSIHTKEAPTNISKLNCNVLLLEERNMDI